ncbi:MAG: ECF transporter S component [Bacteroidales bacterium]|nr:ECF transporter S component [Bacteroidales bacterium]
MTTVAIAAERYNFKSLRTYIAALIFIAGNIVVPQLCHLIPNGGLIFLPIYFFTLVGAFRCGWKVGLLTAVLSPLVNCAFFGMPPVASLPAILVKSITLALAVAVISKKMNFSILSVALAVLAYQLVGMIFEFFLDFNLIHALQDVRIGWPGILIQIVGGYFVIKALDKCRAF